MPANIRFFHSNLVDISTVELTASSQVTTLPVENILNPLKSIPWRTAGKDFEYVDVDLGQNYLVKAFAAAGFNYTEDAVLILCGDDNASFYQPIDASHIGFWKFNGNAQDSSAQENDLIAESIENSDYFASRQDRSVALDGINDYFYIANADAGDFDFGSAQDFTIELWFRFDVVSNAGLVSKWDGNKGYFLEITSEGKLHFKNSDGSNINEMTGSTNLSVSTWYHAAVTADRDGQLTLYLNGHPDAEPVTMTTGDITNTADFKLGLHNSAHLDGALAMAAVSNSIRSSSYIQNTAGTPMKIQEITFGEKTLLECFDPIYARYWRFILSDADNLDGYLDTGRLFLGDWFEPSRNYHSNWTKKIVDPSSITTTLNNVEFSDVREEYIETDLSFPKEVQIPQSDIEKYEEMFIYLGSHKRLFLALDYQNHPRDWSYYGSLTGERSMTHLPGTSHTDGRWTIASLKFKESR